MAGQFLALSLFIMMLSFFIVLNAMSTFQEAKVRPALDSITKAFASKDMGRERGMIFEETPGEAFKVGNAIDQLDALFKSQIIGYEAQRNRMGTVLYVRLPARNFERALIAAAETKLEPGKKTKKSGDFFLPTLISILKSDKTGAPHRMDVFLLTPANPARMQRETPENAAQKIEQVSVYAEALEKAGMPARLMSIGLQEGREDYVDIYFRRFELSGPGGGG